MRNIKNLPVTQKAGRKKTQLNQILCGRQVFFLAGNTVNLKLAVLQ